MSGDFSKLAELIGSTEGWAETVETNYHMTDLLRASHGIATKDFDVAASLTATAARFTHMYEWNTAGITRGSGQLNPVTRAARLWEHKLTGNGTKRGINFGFRPSVATVPHPEFKLPGGRNFSKHVFTGKAWVTEFGMPVVIKPKTAQALLIPLRNGQGQRGKAGDPERAAVRGYAMYSGPVVLPGSKNAGNFTGFWFQWWSSTGRQLITQTAKDIVDGETKAVIAVGRGKGTALKQYSGGLAQKSFELQIEAAKAKASAKTKVSASSIIKRFQQEKFDENLGQIT